MTDRRFKTRGMHTVDDLMQASHVDDSTGCWHYRGSMSEKGCRIRVVMVTGKVVALRGRRAALVIARGRRDLPRGHVAYPALCCHSDDCVNPDHSRAGTKADAHRVAAARGAYSDPVRAIPLLKAAAAKRKRTPELELSVMSDTGRLRDVAARHGISVSTVKVIRGTAGASLKKARSSSVFDWRPA